MKNEICLSGQVEIESNMTLKNEKPPKEIHNFFNNYHDVPSLTKNDVIFCLPEKYLIVDFEIKDSLISEMDIHQDNVTIYPLKKFKDNVSKKCNTYRYYIFLSDDPDLQVLTLDLPL